MSTPSNIDCKLIEMNESSLTETLLFGNSLFDLKKSLALNASIDYILSTGRFEHSENFQSSYFQRTLTLTCFSNYH